MNVIRINSTIPGKNWLYWRNGFQLVTGESTLPNFEYAIFSTIQPDTSIQYAVRVRKRTKLEYFDSWEKADAYVAGIINPQ
jgi:hypothetical protein